MMKDLDNLMLLEPGLRYISESRNLDSEIALGTKEVLYATQVLFQRCGDIGCDMYVCLIHYQKIFKKSDTIKWLRF